MIRGRGAGPSGASAFRELAALVDGSEFGTRTSKDLAQQVEECVDGLALLQARGTTPGPSSCTGLAGTWRLLYTSEASVQSIVRGLPVQVVLQTVELSADGRAGTVTNRMEFSVLGAAIESAGPVEPAPDAPRRLVYTADSRLAFEALGGRLQLSMGPPTRGLWSGAVYLERACRVMRNSRGDTIVLERADDDDDA
ncbi:hypothetical protein FOA52_008006 [Chlamydomonas sp. UWO 241]|nr:hypothetical protein FOA52_008006 [Chlamydomonas sp. UWO 241]